MLTSFELHINLSVSWMIVKEWNIPADDSPNPHVFSGESPVQRATGTTMPGPKDDSPAHKQGSCSTSHLMTNPKHKAR